MKLIPLIIVFQVFLSCASVLAAPSENSLCQDSPSDFKSWAHVGDKQFLFTITKEMLDKTPVWDTKDQNPPLSAKRALELGTKQLQELFGDTKEWRLDNIELFPTSGGHRWIYLINFSDRRNTKADEIAPIFRIFVLMNGVAVPPSISKYPSEAQRAPAKRPGAGR